jgi:class 3 adenylate cyclase
MERRLAAVMAADMVGYSRLMETDEDGVLARQKGHRKELIDPEIGRYRGRIVKTTGDGMLAEFSSAQDTVRCAFTSSRWRQCLIQRRRVPPAGSPLACSGRDAASLRSNRTTLPRRPCAAPFDRTTDAWAKIGTTP